LYQQDWPGSSIDEKADPDPWFDQSYLLQFKKSESVESKEREFDNDDTKRKGNENSNRTRVIILKFVY
jgi:hypothetical protein